MVASEGARPAMRVSEMKWEIGGPRVAVRRRRMIESGQPQGEVDLEIVNGGLFVGCIHDDVHLEEVVLGVEEHRWLDGEAAVETVDEPEMLPGDPVVTDGVADPSVRLWDLHHAQGPHVEAALGKRHHGVGDEVALRRHSAERLLHAEEHAGLALQQRLEGLAAATDMLAKLRTRRDIAQTQLEQLHLDLVRAQASDTADLPDLTGPLQELRFQVDAAREVEELLAR